VLEALLALFAREAAGARGLATGEPTGAPEARSRPAQLLTVLLITELVRCVMVRTENDPRRNRPDGLPAV
jgi:hypothetical protein